MFRKLKRVYSMGYAKYIPNFDKVFPELQHLDDSEMCDRFRRLRLEFYCEKQTPVPIWIRFTLPFAIITMIVMLISLPLVFLFTGHWSYSLGKNNRIYNWFQALKLR